MTLRKKAKRSLMGILPLCALAALLGPELAAAEISKASGRELFAVWAKIQKPLPGKQEPIGGYAAGCLAGAGKLALDGPGYSVMRPSRKRYYGHQDLLTFIRGLGKELKSEHLPLLLVGDLGRPRGGPMPTGHSSHQIGLDVDLWYRMSPKRPSPRERENWSAESFLVGENELSPRWKDAHRKLVSLAAESPLVERVFVHPVIKRDLCQKFAGAPWLYKVRSWWAHHDHLHVRLHCPGGSTSCEAQPPLDPSNDQCGKELAWWFSEEAKEEGKKKDAAFQERAFPELPAACQQMVKGLKAEK